MAIMVVGDPRALAAGLATRARQIGAMARRGVQAAERVLFERDKIGLLNRNDFVRMGYSWKGTAKVGREVFRIAVGSKRLVIKGTNIHIHIRIFNRR